MRLPYVVSGFSRTCLIALAVAITLPSASAQVAPIDAEKLLAGRFGFTPAEVAEARKGQAVAKMLPSQNASDVGVFAAVRIEADANRLANWIKNIAAFRKGADLGVSQRLSDPPRIGDFAALSLDKDELSALRACRPGDCGLMLSDAAIKRFQAEVNWTAADAGARATTLIQQILLGQAQAYLKGGDKALGATHHESTPRVFLDEFQQTLWQAKALYDVTPALATYLEGFPAAKLAGSEQFLYWAKGSLGPDPSISLHQLVTYRTPGGDILVADKQLSATRYLDAAVTVISMASTPDGKGFYVLAGVRARSEMLTGVGARLLRERVESVARKTAIMYLDWIRASLML